MKHIDRVNLQAKHNDLVRDFGFVDYSPREYACDNCGRKLRLVQNRVLYCRRCHKGKLHSRYDFKRDCIV